MLPGPARRYVSVPRKKDRELAEKITSIAHQSSLYQPPTFATKSMQNSPSTTEVIKVSPRMITSQLVKKENDEERVYKIGVRESPKDNQ